MSTNVLRMPFSEWLYRMHEAGLSPQARSLAVYAAAFQISNNDELGQLAGMVSDKGTTDRTYDKYKRKLLEGGWVIITRRKGGRGLGIQVSPAYQETPVVFTDLSPRNPSKYCTRNEEVNTPVEIAVNAEITPAKSADTPVDPAPLPQKSPHTPLKDNNIINTTTTTTVEQEAASGGGIDFDALNGTAIDLTKFIAKHGFMPTENARLALATNIKTFGADAMMEAFSLTLAEMAGGMLGKPYKYLIETARKLKGGGRNKHQEPDESKRDKRRAYLEKLDREEAAKKGRFGHDRS